MNHIILFDGLCNLCNASVNFILKRDKAKIYKFAFLQSQVGIKLCEQHNIDTKDVDSILLLKEGKVYIKSSAILEILKDMSIGWRIFRVGIIFPVGIRNWLYNIIAKNRYWIFGKKEECPIPSKNIQDRFL